MNTQRIATLSGKIILLLLFVSFLSSALAGQQPRTVPQKVDPKEKATNLKPAPKRPTAEDVEKRLRAKSPKPPVCNAVSAKCNPVPRLDSLSPSGNIPPGSAQFTLTVSGSDFVPGAVVQWDYAALSTTYVGNGQLTASVTADLLAAPSVANIAVVNPGPGGGTSASLSLTIGDNPLPAVNFLFPSFVPSGSTDTTIYIGGSGFTDTTAVSWNGENLPVAFYDTTFISALIPSKSLTQPGAGELSVFTPSPGGGSIPTMLFPVTIPLQTNDLAYDAQSGKLIASVPGSAGTSGNSLRFIDPTTGTVSPAYFVGSEPGRVVVSDDGKFAYTGLAGSPSVTRLNLNSLAADLNFQLGTASSFGENMGPAYARDLAVVPGQSHSLVVSLKSVEISPNSAGIAAFDDGVPRQNMTPFYGGSLAFAGSPSTFLAYDNAWYNLSRYQLDGSGVTLLDSAASQNFSSLNPCIVYSSGRLYGCDGNVVDSASEALVGSYPLPAGASQFNSVAPDASSGVTSLIAQDFSLNAYFSAYDQSTFQQVAGFQLTGISFPNFIDFGQPMLTSLVRWGTDGLAFRDTGGQVYVLHSKRLVSKGNPTPSANVLVPAASPVGAGPFVLDVQGTNLVTGSTVNWNGSPRSTTFVSSNELQAQIGALDVAAPGIVNLTVTSPGPGGGTSAAISFTVGSNPAPQLLSVTPTSVAANASAFTLSANGHGFVPGSTIAWDGSPMPTIYDDGGHLHSPMFPPTSKGSHAVTVFNPAPGGGESNKQIVNVTNSNAVPFIFSLSPESAAAGSGTLGVTVSGSNFTTDSVAYWNGAPLSTSYLGPNQLAVTLPSALLAQLGAGHVTVANPAPGGGSSGEMLFPVYLPLPFATDMVYEPFSRQTYLAMSDYNGAGPTLLAVDPATGAIGNPVTLPGNPAVLALSDDGQFVYIGFNPQPLIARYDLTTQSLDTQFAINCFPFSIAVMPGSPRTIAAACNGATGIYDDGVMRPITFNGPSGILAFGSASTLFINSLGVPGANIYRLTVDANGLTLAGSGNGVEPPAYSLGLATGFGDIITPNAQVIDQNSLELLASLSGHPDQLISVVADEGVGRIFGGSNNFFGFVNATAYAFDALHYQSLASLSVPGPSGAVTVLPRLLRWGQDGLMFQGESGFFGQTALYSLQSPSFVLPQNRSPNAVPSLAAVTPGKVMHGAKNLRLQVNGARFARGSVVLWNGSPRETMYVSGSKLVADISTADLAAGGTAAITVMNPSPGGGVSAPVVLNIQ